jgi:phosphotransferase system enzyme I (PtsI)
VAEQLQGVGVSPGVAAGPVHLLHTDPSPIVPDPIPPERVEAEIARFDQARAAARAELEALRDRVHDVLGDPYAGILGAQLLILDDPGLVTKTAQRIRVGRVSARWAFKEVVGEYARRFETVEHKYFRERGGDLSDVHRRVQRRLLGEPGSSEALPEGPTIVVAHSLVPSDTIVLAGKGVIGLATDVGGRTSHTAILAQALSVPAVAGLHDVTQRVHSGDPIVIDGDTGQVQLRPTDAEIERADERRQNRVALERQAMGPAEEQPAVTTDGVRVVLRANIEFPGDADSAERFGAEGIGLYRSEFLFLTCSPELPTEEQHFEAYREIADRVAPHPAVIRTFDLGGEKYFHEVLARDSADPVLGLRGVRLCLRRPDVFRPQLRGLLRAAGAVPAADVRIMLPLVTTAGEVRQVRALLDEEIAQLRAEGLPARADAPLGTMIEVPGAAVAADSLARESDFFSIGTNDLIQYALAVDRGNEAVSYLYQPLHPGVLRMLKFIVESAQRQGIPVSLCGEMAADVGSVGLLVGLGLRELSVQPRSLAAVRQAVREVDASRAARLAEEVLEDSTAEEVEQKLRREDPSRVGPEEG